MISAVSQLTGSDFYNRRVIDGNSMSDATTTDANVCVATEERKPSHINSDVMDIYKSMKATSITELNGVEEGVIKENDVSYSLQVSTDNKVNESEYYKELNADNLGCLLCRKKSDNPESGGFYLYVFDTYYSKDSTADNPIVAVAIQSAFHPDEDAELKDVHNYYREIEVNKINPRNATLLEMHILLSHKEYQACKNNNQEYGSHWDSQAFYDGMEAGIFPYFVDNIEEVMDVKKDWIQEAMKAKFSDSELAEKSMFDKIKEAIVEYLQKLAENVVNTEKNDENNALSDVIIK